MQALFSQGVLATDGVGEVGVTAVDDDVALIEHGGELLDNCVDGCARLDHNQDAAGRLEGVNEFLQGLGTDEVAVCAVLSQQCVGLLYGTVVQCHGVAVTCQVAGEVCAHDSKAGDTNLCLLVFSHVYKDTRLGQAIYRWTAVLCPKESQFRLDYLRELPARHPRGG